MKRTKTTCSRVGLARARDYERCLSYHCRHVSNDRFYGKPFLLADFQRENIWKPILGTGRMGKEGYERRYHRALIGLPSGYGKSDLATAMLLTIATMEPIHNGQYGLVASSLDQVGNLYTKVSTMIKLDDDLSAQWIAGKRVIEHRETGAKIMVFPNKASALESWHLNVAIFDELHVYRDSSVWDAAVKGQKVLDDPLLIGITTAGDRREGFLWELLKDSADDPGMYVYWLGLDDKDNINRKRSWDKLMVAPWVTWDDIQDQRNSASSRRSFERYTANRFPLTSNADAVFTARQLNQCARGRNEFDFEQPFALGIDGATSGDTFALVAYQERRNANGNAVGYTHEWVYDDPGDDGRYEIEQILELVADLYSRYWQMQTVAMDPNRLILFGNLLQNNYGVPIVSMAQNNATMCQACALTTYAVKHNRIKLAGCPKLKSHLANVTELEREPYGTRFGKADPAHKIDAAIALALAQLAYEQLVKTQDKLVEVY